MNYTIYADDQLIYNRLIIDEHGKQLYGVLDPVLNMTTDEFCSLTYRAKKGSPAFDRSVELIPLIKVYKDGVLKYTGRILRSVPNIHAEKEIYVEDFLGVLCDSVYRPFEFYGTPKQLLTAIVTSHNAQVDSKQQFYAVECDIDSENITRSSEGYDSCWKVIKSKLLDMIGGYMWVDYDASERPILHYSMSARNYSTQVIRFGKNLVDYNVKYDFDGFYTACVPLGAKDEETKEYITIASVNNGVDYLIDATNAARYGVIYAPPSETTWEDVHYPAILLTKAQDWIRDKAARLVKEISLTARDLSNLDVDSSMIEFLDSVSVEADEIDDRFIVKTLSRPLDRPLQLEINMGDTRSSLTGAAASAQASTTERIEIIESSYVSNTEAHVIAREEISNDTSIVQRAEAIIMTALQEYVRTSDYQTFVSSIETNFAILAGEISANFTSTSEQISNLQNSTEAQINTIYSFIRLLGTVQDEHGQIVQEGGIVIGESTSAIKLKLENDVLYFFVGDEKIVTPQNAIAYFASNNLVVNRTNIQNLTLGTQGEYLDARILGTGDNVGVMWSGRLS